MSSTPEPSRAPDRSWLMGFGVGAVASAFPIWVPDRLPMTDLPQHAAQLTLWRQLGADDAATVASYEVNWFTPYLLAYSLARGVAEIVSLFGGGDLTAVVTGLKVVITASVWGLAGSCAALLRAVGKSPWPALVGFPLAFNFSFYWGFVSYALAVPLVIGLTAASFVHGRAPTLRRGMIVAALGLLLFATHGLALAVGGFVAGAVLALHARSASGLASRLLPLVGVAAVAALWMARAPLEGGSEARPPVWSIGAHRVAHAAGWQLAPDTSDGLALVFFGLLLAIAALGGVKRDRAMVRWVPLGIALALFLFFPESVFGIDVLYPRFAVFVVPFALLALAPTEPGKLARIARGVLPAVVVGWLGLLTVRFVTFDAEAAGFQQATNAVPAHARVRGLIFLHRSDAVPGALPFVHFPAWIVAEKGGVLSRSFASAYTSLVRYLPDKEPPGEVGAEWQPGSFRWEGDGEAYDWFVARAKRDVGPELARRSQGRIARVAHAGEWWVYRKLESTRPVGGRSFR